MMGKIRKHDRRALREAKARKSKLQVGALCYRYGADGLEIMLITSRRTQRWIGPKGWTMRGKTHAEAAAVEAWEEAGAKGAVSKKAIGFFSYRKNLGKGRHRKLTVQLFALEVSEFADKFPELGQRKRKWFSPKKAMKRADPAEFSKLIKKFARSEQERLDAARTAAVAPAS